jgi:hypothetical protein
VGGDDNFGIQRLSRLMSTLTFSLVTTNCRSNSAAVGGLVQYRVRFGVLHERISFNLAQALGHSRLPAWTRSFRSAR